MPRRRRDVDVFVNVFTNALNGHATEKLESHEYDGVGSMNELMRAVRTEYTTGQLRQRVRRYVTRHPLIALPRPSVVRDAILYEVAEGLLDEALGNTYIPRGIEDGDCWLSPSSPIQRMFQDNQGEDAILIINAIRGDDGQLHPAFCWTESPEVIAEAQKGHRKYMALLAAENRT